MGQAAKKGDLDQRKRLAIQQGRIKPQPGSHPGYSVDAAAQIMAAAVVASLVGIGR